MLPTHHANVYVDPRGFIYTVSPLSQKDQIKKLNSIGNNVYTTAEKAFGERERRGNQIVNPQFVDVTVDEQGIVSALDFNSGRIYQYDQSANLLAIFGGRGSQRGRFELPQSLAVGREGKIFVLDANRNNVQVFRPTEFAGLLHDRLQALLRRQVRRRLQDLGGGAAPEQLLRAGPHRPGQVLLQAR